MLALLDMRVYSLLAHENEPVTRVNLLATKKPLIEGSLEEIKEVLGRQISARIFTIILPQEKFAD